MPYYFLPRGEGEESRERFGNIGTLVVMNKGNSSLSFPVNNYAAFQSFCGIKSNAHQSKKTDQDEHRRSFKCV